jgi:hypothetical protein
MKENKLTVQINIPASDLFDFTVKPSNTSLWIDSIMTELTNEWPPRVDTIYRNTADGKNWDEYVVKKIEQDKLFELESKDKNYHVRYTYKNLGDDKSELEYFEWVDRGQLENPFSQNILDNLKTKLEKI